MNVPSELRKLLNTTYNSTRLDPSLRFDTNMASEAAWTDARRLGWYRNGDKWFKRNETEASWDKYNNFWKRNKPENLKESLVTALGKAQIRESLVPFKARILLAVPGKSLNNRIYPKETLQQCAPLYAGKPFILDHNIEDANKVVGMFTNAEYTVETSPYTRQSHEGLWADAIGLMEQDLFDKMKGTALTPPLIRNVSIGGQGDGDFNVDGGTLIKNFVPAEGSVTAFPGIPTAHVAQIEAIREHFLQSDQKTSMQDVRSSLESRYGIRKRNPNMKEKPPVGGGRVFHETPPAEQLLQIREGEWQPSVPPNRPALRGATAEPDSQQFRYDWTVPQQTYARDAGNMPDPSTNYGDFAMGQNQNISSVSGFNPTSKNFTYAPRRQAGLQGYSSTEDAPGTTGAPGSKDARSWTDKQKVPPLGRTTTKTSGFGKINRGKLGPGASGMDQDEERRWKAALSQSLANDLSRVLYKMRYGTEQMPLKPGLKMPEEEEEEEEAKVDVSGPEEEEEAEAVMTTQKDGEEEEEEENEESLLHQLSRELAYDLGSQSGPIPRTMTSISKSRYNGRGINATHSPPNESDPRQYYSAGKKKAAYARASEKKEEEEEEEERVARINKLLNRIIAVKIRNSAPGTEPRSNPPIPKTPKLGNTTTKTKGFGSFSPTGTGITDQDEEEESHRIRQDSSDVDKQEKPQGEEEEESRMPNDLLPSKGEFVQANPVRSGGEEEEEEERATVTISDDEIPKIADEEESLPRARVIIPDLTPDDFHAPAMPHGTGIEKLWNQIHPDPRQDPAQVAKMVEFWRQMKTPRQAPPPEVYVQLPQKEKQKTKMTERLNNRSIAETTVNTMPWLGVQAKGMAPIFPTYTGPAMSSGTKSIMTEAEETIKEIQKRRGSEAPGRMTTAMAHEAYMQMLSQGRILQVRR
jgi:hypothetical protein